MSTVFDQPISSELAAKEAQLLKNLAGLGSVIVAYSGGVDSSVLAHYAKVALGEKAKIVIAISPSLAAAELADARSQARLANFDLIEIQTDEVDSKDYRANDSMRCFFCKSTLFGVLETMRLSQGSAAVAYGANLDDLNDYRPGHQAAKQYGVIAPLIEAALSKAEIRLLAKSQNLPSAERPQAACLSSRFAEHTHINAERLALIDKLEQVVRNFEFRQVRVRYLSPGSGENEEAGLVKLTIEVGQDELIRFEQNQLLEHHLKEALLREAEKCQALISQIDVDMDGYVQGKAALLSSTASEMITPIAPIMPITFTDAKSN